VQRTLLADRTEEQPSETALPPGPNDEEVGVVPGVDQYLGRRTLVVVALDLYRRGQRSNLAGGPIDYLQHGLPNLIGGDELVAGFEGGDHLKDGTAPLGFRRRPGQGPIAALRAVHANHHSVRCLRDCCLG